MCYSIPHLQMLRTIALAKNFSFPAGFRRRSYRQLQNIYNGIGAEWMPGPIRRAITWLLTDLEAAALVHDYEWSLHQKSVWHFLLSNWRLWYNSAKLRRFFAGGAAALLCTVFGYRAYRKGKEKC